MRDERDEDLFAKLAAVSGHKSEDGDVTVDDEAKPTNAHSHSEKQNARADFSSEEPAVNAAIGSNEALTASIRVTQLRLC